MAKAVPGMLVLWLLCAGCAATRTPETPSGRNLKLLTFNVNWGAPRPDLALQAIRESKADVICLQETTPEWERYLRRALITEYPFMEFRDSRNRAGGGLAFLSRHAGHEVAYVPSNTGWFDGWIKSFPTGAGTIQVLNVHLRPPVSDRGSFGVNGYLGTGDDRLQEMERFTARARPDLPLIVAGDFNDHQRSPVIRFLQDRKMRNALPEFDRSTPTWQWRYGLVTFRRRMDHILYPPELHCYSARVLRAGASDHFPVEAVLGVQ